MSESSKFHLLIFYVPDTHTRERSYRTLGMRIRKLLPKAVRVSENAFVIADFGFADAEHEIIQILPEHASFFHFALKRAVTGVYAPAIQKLLLDLGLDAYCTRS